MSRKVFFSFHFQRDAWRAAQVRNRDLIANEDEYGVIDAVAWEKIERAGDAAIRRWIDNQLRYTAVTAVLIGAETASREYVMYEIRESWARVNGIVGVRVHRMKNADSQTDPVGLNPLDLIRLANGIELSQVFKTYDWVGDDGRNNLGTWVEEARTIAEGYAGERALMGDSVDSGRLATAARAVATAPTIIRNPPGPWGQ